MRLDTLAPQCLACRRRRVKCDGTQPTCQKCAKKGIECPGYKRGLVWKSVGAKEIRRREARKDPERLRAEDDSPDEHGEGISGESSQSGSRQSPEREIDRDSVGDPGTWWNAETALEVPQSYTYLDFPEDMLAFQTIDFYNTEVAPDIIPHISLLPRALIPLEAFPNMPAIAKDAIITTVAEYVRIRYRDGQAGGGGGELTPVTHRQRTIEGLNQLLSDPEAQASPLALAIVLIMLNSEIQISSTGPEWHAHLLGAAAIIRMRGGMAACIDQIPWMRTQLVGFMIMDAMAGTTTSAADLRSGGAVQRHASYLPFLLHPRFLEHSISTPCPVPAQILEAVIRTNLLRAELLGGLEASSGGADAYDHSAYGSFGSGSSEGDPYAAAGDPSSSSSTATGLLAKQRFIMHLLEAFDPSRWARDTAAYVRLVETGGQATFPSHSPYFDPDPSGAAAGPRPLGPLLDDDPAVSGWRALATSFHAAATLYSLRTLALDPPPGISVTPPPPPPPPPPSSAGGTPPAGSGSTPTPPRGLRGLGFPEPPPSVPNSSLQRLHASAVRGLHAALAELFARADAPADFAAAGTSPMVHVTSASSSSGSSLSSTPNPTPTPPPPPPPPTTTTAAATPPPPPTELTAGWGAPGGPRPFHVPPLAPAGAAPDGCFFWKCTVWQLFVLGLEAGSPYLPLFLSQAPPAPAPRASASPPLDPLLFGAPSPGERAAAAMRAFARAKLAGMGPRLGTGSLWGALEVLARWWAVCGVDVAGEGLAGRGGAGVGGDAMEGVEGVVGGRTWDALFAGGRRCVFVM